MYSRRSSEYPNIETSTQFLTAPYARQIDSASKPLTSAQKMGVSNLGRIDYLESRDMCSN
jgi:hypothetical protein